MFGSIGIVEIVILAGIALVVMGPEKFPDFARTVARMVRDVRGYISEAQRDLEREIRPVKKELDQLSRVDPETYIDRLAESAFKDEEKKDEAEYNPEPEGPTMDNTFTYGSYDATNPSEEQASGGEAPPPASETPDESEKKSSDQYAD